MSDAFLQALGTLATWPNPLHVVLGTLIGQAFGVIPGLSGSTAIVLLMPLTFSMPPLAAMFLLLPMLGGSSQGGALSAILINVPGTAVNTATALDGHALARQGRAGVAIGASATASALGAIFGLAVLAVTLPVLRRSLLWFGPPEFFLLTLMALAFIAVAVEGTFLAGLISGVLGLLLGMHGYVRVVGGERFTFGSTYLWDGVRLAPAFIGLFAIAGAVELLIRSERTSAMASSSGPGVWEGVTAVFSHTRVLLRSSTIGLLVGIVPAVGGTVANMLAYAAARRTSPAPETFGRGNVAGVIAPEAASDAKDGGALMPTLALGIPGSEAMAILLGVFALHGIAPGQQMLTTHLSVVWAIVLALLAGNIISSLLALLASRQLIRLMEVPASLYAPAILCLSLVGAYTVDRNPWDPLAAMLFGGAGYAMKALGYSRIALVIGLMLGRTAEVAFFQSLDIARGSPWVFITRPVSLVLVLLITAALATPFLLRCRESAGRVPNQGDTSV